ncbi:unnamed protein product [Prunus armeniaca]
MFDYCNVMSSRSDAKSGPFLQEEIMSLKGLELLTQHAEHVESAPETIPEASSFKRRSLQRKNLLSQSGGHLERV